MSTRFKTNAVGFRRNGKVLVPAIILSSLAVGLVLYNYAASAASLLESVTIKQYSSRSSLAALLGSSTASAASGPMSSGGTSSSGSVAAGSRPANQQLKAVMQLPIAKPDATVVQQRCGATLGDWCGRYEAQEPVPAVAPPTGTRECLWGCNFVGEPCVAYPLAAWQPAHLLAMPAAPAEASGARSSLEPGPLTALQGCATPQKAGAGVRRVGQGTTA